MVLQELGNGPGKQREGREVRQAGIGWMAVRVSCFRRNVPGRQCSLDPSPAHEPSIPVRPTRLSSLGVGPAGISGWRERQPDIAIVPEAENQVADAAEQKKQHDTERRALTERLGDIDRDQKRDYDIH